MLHDSYPNIPLKVLKYFGDEITTLSLEYHNDYRRFDKSMDDAINTYCHKLLKQIKFIDAERFTMIDVTTPFKNVETVIFFGGSLCKLIQNFDKVFPNANTLEFNEVEVSDYSDKIELKTWPQLKNLKIRIASGQQSSTTFFKKLIAINLQLEIISLDLEEYMAMMMLRLTNWMIFQ